MLIEVGREDFISFSNTKLYGIYMSKIFLHSQVDVLESCLFLIS